MQGRANARFYGGILRFANLSMCAVAAGLFLGSLPAQAQNQGFTLNRYEPTPAGEWSFMVDHPWYSSTRYFAAGVTLNYAHNPLLYGLTDAEGNYVQQQTIIAHQLVGSLDLAGSFLDRVTLSASLPVTFLERGQPLGGITPNDGVVVGDPRFGVMVRLWGQPDRSPFSISIGSSVWVPLRGFDTSLPQQSSDSEVRVLPKLVLAGLGKRIRWSLNLGFLYRPTAVIGNFTIPDGSSASSSLQIGASIQYADTEHRFAIGPEALFSTQVLNGNAFRTDFTSLEVLLGAHYNIARQVQIGLAGGLGVLREAGTPDFRGLFRLAYAPIRDLKPRAIDTDHDGVEDKQDACPLEPGPATADPRTNGCPVHDRDQDGVVDEIDQCPTVAQGSHPDPAKPGCPDPDPDHDGVAGEQDVCPEIAQGDHPDPSKPGCPDKDATGDYGSSYTGTPTPSCRRRINGLYQLFHVGQRFFQLTR
jgi:hypothetical protein